VANAVVMLLFLILYGWSIAELHSTTSKFFRLCFCKASPIICYWLCAGMAFYLALPALLVFAIELAFLCLSSVVGYPSSLFLLSSIFLCYSFSCFLLF
jgi:hypothetical protein